MSISMARGSFGHRSHGHFTSGGIDDRIESTLPPVFSPNMRAAVIEQVEFDIASAPDQLLLAVLRVSRRHAKLRRTNSG